MITRAATGNANVKALVYIDAYVPQAGDSIAALTAAKPGSALGVDPTTVFNFVPFPDQKGVDTYIKPELFPGIMANGVPAREAAVLAAGQRPIALSAITEVATGVPAWKTIPSWDLIGTADRVIPPAEPGGHGRAGRRRRSAYGCSAGHSATRRLVARPQATWKDRLDRPNR